MHHGDEFIVCFMKRYQLIFSYDGSCYDGFQRQPSKKTIQGEVERVLTKLETKPVSIVASGRTDAKVHALSQVAHVDLERDIKVEKLRYYLNRELPNDIWIKEVKIVDESFHARHDVVKKRYRYLLNMGEHDPLASRHVWQFHRHLNVDKMQQAAQLFLGTHHFGSFTIAKNKPSYERDMLICKVSVIDQQVVFEFEASGFMQHMIRLMVGALVQVGTGRIQIEDVQMMLDSKGAKKCIYKAPPEGLYLVEVVYEDCE